MLPNDEGTDFLIVKLSAMVILALLLLAVIGSCASDFALHMSALRARAGAIEVAEKARAAYAADCPDRGERCLIHLSVPASVRVIGFGAASEQEAENRHERSYFIRYGDGSLESFVSDVPFARGNCTVVLDEPLYLYPGDYGLEIEAVTVNGSVKAGISTEES